MESLEEVKLLIAVKSCQRDKNRGDHDIIRSTWGKDAKALGIDIKFFMGAYLSDEVDDEIYLNCPDDYNGLPFKTREICKWVDKKPIDYIFLADTDTYLIPRLMLQSKFETADYVGYFRGNTSQTFYYEAPSRDGVLEIHEHCYPWASGGEGYFLSRKAFTRVTNESPTSWAEDLWIGQIFGPLAAKNEITILDMPRKVYSWHQPPHVGEDAAITANWMKDMYMEHSWR